ncbi:cupin domain-containing protein [Teredinibacter purpureus]|uniref:cupin domain-containing protein n=1 Tax=Teredinibacter purpureus TaxID=2731756 RepID=UPI0005F86E80|nr:cupin domain-containing protein [Teredinibacter purpureus]
MNNTHPFARLTHLGEMPIDIFLRDYWQQKPLLIRQAFPNFIPPVSADELAGFSLDEDVVSRLIVKGSQQDDWTLQHGPLPETVFEELPKSHWTLLIQHADLLDPELNQLLEAFRFIPNWRLDDIMLSYAADGGSVGPHFDYYDVFLLQAQGTRRWRLGQQCDSDTPLIQGVDLKILEQFNSTDEWIVAPGDLLYIPPNLAHWGEAIGDDCMTYSIGFRAPSYSDIMLDFAQEMASLANADMRYTDKGLTQQSLSGEITPEAISKVEDILKRFATNKGLIANWFGEYMTRPNPGGIDACQSDLTPEQLTVQPCALSPFARCAFYETSDHCVVFINGEKWHCTKEMALKLSQYEAFLFDEVNPRDHYLLQHLAEEGLLCDAENQP